MIITIEGNIGAGKSVYAESLSKLLMTKDFEVIHMKEPVEDWINFNGVNFLKMFYDNTKRWAFTFQVNALFTTKDMESQAVNHSQAKRVVIMERSSFSVLEIFCKYLNRAIFDPVETTIIEKLKFKVSEILENYENHVIIYIKSSPEVCMERIIARSRKEEIGKINLHYLQNLHELHEKSLNKYSEKLLTIDGTSYDQYNVERAKLLDDKPFSAFNRVIYALRTWLANS